MEIQPQTTVLPLTETLEFAEPPEPVSLADPPPRQTLNLKYLEPEDSTVSHGDRAVVRENRSNTDNVRSVSMAFFRRSLAEGELRTPRIQAGLTFVGFGALGLAFLLLYTCALHPEFDWVALVSEYWYPYTGFTCLGVAGLIVLARESLRL